jgi:AcrR family transcriptional regulator
VRVADRDGLDNTSLRKVAAELGVHVTSLYNHVATKDALLDGIVEALFVDADLPVGTVSWEQWVRGFVDGAAAMARRHPGAFAVLMRRPVQGQQATAVFEAGLSAFTAAGMALHDSYAAVKSVALGVLGVCVEQAYAANGDALRTDVSALPPANFPRMHELTAADEDVDVVAALRELLVVGFAARLRRA